MYPSSLPNAFDPMPMTALLDTLALDWLYDSERNLLVVDFTREEKILGIQSLTAGKALMAYL